MKVKQSLATLMVLMMTLMMTSVGTYAATNDIQMNTDYTYIGSKAGEKITYPITVSNSGSTGHYVDMAVTEIPEGWESTLKATSYVIKQIYVNPGESKNLSLSIDIPKTAKEGTYTIVTEAKDEEGTKTLRLKVDVSELSDGASSFTADYPDLTGTATTNFDFRVNMTNNHMTDVSYSLEANPPTGWTVTFTPASGSDTVASVNVPSNTNQGVDVHVKAPEFTPEGTYEIPVIARSSEEVLDKTLTVTVQGSYDIAVSTPTGKLSDDITAGKEKMIKLTVTNKGGSDLKDVDLSSWAPTDWEVRFETPAIDVIKAGESKEVTAYVKADSKAISGDYVVSMTAKSAEVSDKVEFRMTVRTSTAWGAVGVVIILLVAILLGGIMKKYGRR